ncbi:MAG TPA: two-component regulator propeller domain-containing protein, partial [Gemmatimonadales bacterium]|nr:two-component regulator propeller domain-containing protein [Gemmatimonadales bacterium]
MQTAHRARQGAVELGVLAALLLASCPGAFALDPALNAGQYAHKAWRTREGFINGAINCLAQTPDGYLWLGTEFGLLRFDGVRTLPWQPPPGHPLPSDYIAGLLVARDGTLWIGTLKGLASWKAGTLTQYPELAGRHVLRILEDREGSVWAAAAYPGRLCTIRNGSVACHGDDGSLGAGVHDLFEDKRGGLWVGLRDALCRWKPGPRRCYPLTEEPNGIQLAEDEDGALLVGTGGTVRRFVDGKTEAYPHASGVRPFHTRELLRDRDGGLWIGTLELGLVHMHQRRADVFGPADGLSGALTSSLFEDREGSVWVASYNGLDRFRNLAVATFSVAEGLSHDAVQSVLADSDGSVWLGTYVALNRWRDGQVTVLSTGSNGPQSLFRDDRGRIWVSTRSGIGYLEDERFVSVRGVPGGEVLAIAQGTKDDLWFANFESGLFRLSARGQVQPIPQATLGHQGRVSALAADAQGGLWLGFREGGIAYFADGQVRASYGSADGLGDGRVGALRLEPDGTLWASTAGGLS